VWPGQATATRAGDAERSAVLCLIGLRNEELLSGATTQHYGDAHKIDAAGSDKTRSSRYDRAGSSGGRAARGFGPALQRQECYASRCMQPGGYPAGREARALRPCALIMRVQL
jgi:hypothetical protein